MSLDVYLTDEAEKELYWANITHNLNKMADAAGIYKALWRPEEIGISKAGQLVEPIEAGLLKMVREPSRFEQFDSPNGWGLYKHFLPWIAKYLEACRRWPEARVSVSR